MDDGVPRMRPLRACQPVRRSPSVSWGFFVVVYCLCTRYACDPEREAGAQFDSTHVPDLRNRAGPITIRLSQSNAAGQA